MSRFSEFFADRPVLADGAMGTVLYARGFFVNRCYDELNLSDPNLILGVHEEYLQAGAEILETNTFGANRFRLTRHGLAGKVKEINEAGVRLAREAAAHLNAQTLEALKKSAKDMPATAGLFDLTEQALERYVEAQKGVIDQVVQQTAAVIETTRQQSASASKVAAEVSKTIQESIERAVSIQKAVLDLATRK